MLQAALLCHRISAPPHAPVIAASLQLLSLLQAGCTSAQGGYEALAV